MNFVSKLVGELKLPLEPSTWIVRTVMSTSVKSEAPSM